MRLLKIYAILCLIAFLGGLLQPALSGNSIVSLFSPTSEAFTELYFEDHQNLPTRLAPYTEYGFRFTIHNRGNAGFQYRYRVSADIGNETFLLTERSVFVEKNAYANVQEQFFTKDTITTPSRITVTLLHNNQHIAFWMEGNT